VQLQVPRLQLRSGSATHPHNILQKSTNLGQTWSSCQRL
jgi:hypothetical protein